MSGLSHGGEDCKCTYRGSAPDHRLVREGSLSELAVCIVDELHMICDPNRGAALELSITKLLHSPASADIQVPGRRTSSQTSSCCFDCSVILLPDVLAGQHAKTSSARF